MEIVVDGSTGFATSGDDGTLESVIQSIRKSVSTRKRVVVSLTLDGEALTTDREEALAQRKSGEYGLLEVKTSDPFDISVGTLSGLKTHLDNLERSHSEAAGFFESGEFAKALDKYEACFSGWDILVRVVRDVGNLTSADFGSMRSGNDSIEDRFQSLHEILLRFASAMDVKDMQRIGELGGQDLKPMIAVWRDIVAQLSNHVARASGAAP